MIYIPTNYEENWRTLLIPVRPDPTPSHQTSNKTSLGFNFIKEIPLNEISEKLKMLLKKVKGVNFTKEIPLNEFSENIKILLKLEKKFKKGPLSLVFLKHLTFSMIFQKHTYIM